ncbi:MAG: hypothetical protein LIP23_09010 [Planctomycetes bacterium]|nr:hypothetical protein [Planctomycetota bacterium]
MADERRHPMLLRPSFLLFCLYVMAYLTIRAYGEIIYQRVDMQVTRGGIVHEFIVGTDYSLPRWRRQLYRAFFSPLMVVEEEGRRLVAGSQGLVEDARDYGRGFLPD